MSVSTLLLTSVLVLPSLAAAEGGGSQHNAAPAQGYGQPPVYFPAQPEYAPPPQMYTPPPGYYLQQPQMYAPPQGYIQSPQYYSGEGGYYGGGESDGEDNGEEDEGGD